MHVEHARGKQQPILLETVITSKRINISQIIVMIETGCKAIMLLVSCDPISLLVKSGHTSSELS